MKIEIKCTVVDVVMTSYLDPQTGKQVQRIKLTLLYPNAPVGENDQNRTGELTVIAPGDQDLGVCKPGDTYVLRFYE